MCYVLELQLNLYIYIHNVILIANTANSRKVSSLLAAAKSNTSTLVGSHKPAAKKENE